MPSSFENAGFSGLRVVVVEDETLVAINLESMLEDMGCTVVGLAMRYEQAERMIEEADEIDAAILDVNIGGRAVFPIAGRLSEKGVPILFATGYGRAGLAEAWQDRPVVQKPYTEAEVETGLRQALATLSSDRVGGSR